MATFSEAHKRKVTDALVSGNLARTASRLFHECDSNKSGGLELSFGEVRIFIVKVFELLDLAQPVESLIYDVYKRFDTGNKGLLNFEESLQLVVFVCNVVLGIQTPPMGVLEASNQAPTESLGTLGSSYVQPARQVDLFSSEQQESLMTTIAEPENDYHLDESMGSTTPLFNCHASAAPSMVYVSEFTPTPSVTRRSDAQSPDAIVCNARPIINAVPVQPSHGAAPEQPVFNPVSVPIRATVRAPSRDRPIQTPRALDGSFRSSPTSVFASAPVPATVLRTTSRERALNGPFVASAQVVRQATSREGSLGPVRRAPSRDTSRCIPSGAMSPRWAIPPHLAGSSVSYASTAANVLPCLARETAPSAVTASVTAVPIRRQVSREPTSGGRSAGFEVPAALHAPPRRQVSPRRRVNGKTWSEDRAIALDAYPRGPFASKVKILPRRAAADIRIAVDLLNTGDIECREDFAVVYAESLDSHVLLFKVGKEKEARAGLEMSQCAD